MGTIDVEGVLGALTLEQKVSLLAGADAWYRVEDQRLQRDVFLQRFICPNRFCRCAHDLAACWILGRFPDQQ